MTSDRRPVSLSLAVAFDCPACATASTTETWLVVDLEERPELAEAVREGSLNAWTCDACGHRGIIDGPVLVARGGRRPVLVYAPPVAPSTADYLDILTNWWAATSGFKRPPEVAEVPRQLLALAASGDPVTDAQPLNHSDSSIDDHTYRAFQSDLRGGSDARIGPLRRFLEADDDQAHAVQAERLLDSENLGQLLRQLYRCPNDDYEARIWLAGAARRLVSRPDEPQLWAALSAKLGNAYAERLAGERADNLERAIAHFDAALEVFTREAAPWEWAGLQLNLGGAYVERVVGERADNVERAIAHFDAALEIHTRQAGPSEWAAVQLNLGGAYVERVAGERAGNVERAIAHFHAALEVYSREAAPDEWATLQSNLGVAYRERLSGEPADNVEQAIAHFNAALEVRSRKAAPWKWAGVQSNLGRAYVARVAGDRADNLERAIAFYRAALEIYSREVAPWEWAGVQSNLGSAYVERVAGDRADNLERAIAFYRAALEISSREVAPWEWARVQQNLGNAYRGRLVGDRDDNLEEAIACYEAALDVYSREAAPRQWAAVRSNLGNAYRERVAGDRADNLERAIAHCEAAIEVYTRQAAPFRWAMSQSNRGAAYAERVAGERADNLEQAIACYKSAIEVYSREAAPWEWAAVQQNLGNAYRERLVGDRADNLERATAHCEAALAVYSREAAPWEWATTQTNLGDAYRERVAGEAADNVERAIACYEAALEVHSRDAAPWHWATVQSNLGNAYFQRVAGEAADNVERAIACYEAALEVHSRDAAPWHWATVQSNLGNAYVERLAGERADNRERAIAFYQAALEVHSRVAAPWEWARVQQNLGNAYRERVAGDRADNLERAVACYEAALELHSAGGHWHLVRSVATGLGLTHCAREEWGEAAAAFERGVGAGELLYATGVLAWSKRAELAETSRLFGLAALALVRAGQPGRAAVLAETSRARELGEALDRDRAALAELAAADPDTHRVFVAAAERLRALAGAERGSQLGFPVGEAELRAETEAAKSELETAVARIQTVAGFERFLAPPDWEELGDAVEPGCGLVYAVPTELATAVILLHRPGPNAEAVADAELVAFTTAQLWDVLIRRDGNAGERGYLPFQLGHLGVDGGDLSRALSALGPLAQVVDEVVARGRLQRVVAVAGGRLGLFPLAYCPWTDEDGQARVLADRMTVSYASSARVLAHSRKAARADAACPVRVAAAAYSPDAEDGVLIGRRRLGAHLPCAAVEATVVATCFPHGHAPLIGRDATVSAVLALAADARFVHLACHAGYDANQPLASALELADGRLTLARLMDAHNLAGVRLVVASACQSGVSGALQLPDEALGLPTGWLLAGAAGVVATLWPVNDLASALVTARFYAELDPTAPSMDPTRALARAQDWLAQLRTTDLLALLAGAGEAAAPANPLGGLNPTLARRLIEGYEAAALCGLTRPFAHPTYWAGYVHVGA